MNLHALDPLLYPIDDDLLYKNTHFIDNLYKLITESVQSPYVISIDGEWGTGKTTIMKILQKKLESEYAVFWFNTWEYQDTQNIALAFLQLLFMKFVKNDAKSSTLRMLGAMTRIGLDVTVKALTKGTVTLDNIINGFKDTEKNMETPLEKYENTIEIIKKEFKDLIKIISEKHNNKEVIIFFDDLYRCLPDKAIQLLEAIKNLFVTPDCKSIFICGINTNIAKRFISSHYNEIEDTFAINYFRKIFNLTITVPYSINTNHLLLQHIIKLYNWDNTKAATLSEQIVASGICAEIHSVRQYLNIANNFYAFLKLNPDYTFDTEADIDFIILILVIKEVWQSLYDKLIKETFKERCNIGDLIKRLGNRNEEKSFFSPKQLKFLTIYIPRSSKHANINLLELLKKYSL